ncbi:MAG TPA: sugar phosphate isomerase/epimerase [Ktedonobacteraceae bacterium]|jgi:sugar phosphate isomerase/epimerase|nr:sugar phosphate isomerase/epimerase [Ktedonobacteraceae bacterium]
MTHQLLGLQLYTVRDETAKDFRQTLKYVAEMGYTNVEFAGYGNMPSKELATVLADLNLRAASTHVALNLLEEDLERELNYCLDLGCNFLVVPWISEEWRSAEGLRKLGTRLNEFGRVSQERGVTLVYHNHNFEFEQADGAYLLDTLLGVTNPDFVKLEFDTYWAAFAGVDPAAFMRKHAGRVALVHLKDMTPERTFTEVGAGTLDIAGYIEAAKASNVQFYFVENDAPAIPSLESARRSFENLQKLLG